MAYFRKMMSPTTIVIHSRVFEVIMTIPESSYENRGKYIWETSKQKQNVSLMIILRRKFVGVFLQLSGTKHLYDFRRFGNTYCETIFELKNEFYA